MKIRRRRLNLLELCVVIAIVAVALTLVNGTWKLLRRSQSPILAARVQPAARTTARSKGLSHGYARCQPSVDTSGFSVLNLALLRWKPDASLKEISDVWSEGASRAIKQIEERMADGTRTEEERLFDVMQEASIFNSEGQPEKSYALLEQVRSLVEQDERIARAVLASVIYFQGICAMRRGENDNCIMCRGESSCILPVSPAAVH